MLKLLIAAAVGYWFGSKKKQAAAANTGANAPASDATIDVNAVRADVSTWLTRAGDVIRPE